MQEQLPPPAGSLPDEEDYRRFYHLESYLFRTVHDRFAKEAGPQFLAGSLFRVSGLGIKGLPEPRFAG